MRHGVEDVAVVAAAAAAAAVVLAKDRWREEAGGRGRRRCKRSMA